MEIIDKGDIPVERLFFYLEEYFGVKHFKKMENEYTSEFISIENDNGTWTIKFKSYPPQETLLYILSIFKSKLSHQNLVIYLHYSNYSHSAWPNSYYKKGQSSIGDFLKFHEEGRRVVLQQYI